VSRWGPHGVVARLEEDRRQRCTWRRSRQLGQRGAIGDRPEERSMVPIDRSAGNAVAGLGCGVTERRGAAVAVRGCSGVQRRWDEEGKVSSGVWRAKAILARCMVGTWRQQRHAAPASEARWHGRETAAWSEQRRVGALSHGARSEDAGAV
jgi:hypothetical protein